MKTWKHSVLFYIGGTAYMTLEFAYRGRSHGSMFLLGGTCFLLLGRLSKANLPPALRGLVGAGIITAVELGAGLIANRRHTVWDYRSLPANFKGQICLPYSLLWVPVSMIAMEFHRWLDK